MVRKVTETPQVTPNKFQEDLAADRLVIHHSTVQRALRREMLERLGYAKEALSEI